MKMRLITFLVCLIFIMLSACKKEKLPDKFCEEIPPPGNSLWGWQFSKQLPYREMPCFNPNNPDEFIVRSYNQIGDTAFQLIKYNMVSGEKQVIYEGNFGVRPRWSRKDWILLNLRDFNIYKIKSNGDSLTQLTTGGNCLGGEWSKTGDRFVYELFGVLSGSARVICDDLGNPLDTALGGGYLSASWQHDSLMVAANVMGGVTIVDLGSGSDVYQGINPVNSVSNTLGKTTAEWLDDKNVIWANINGIFTTNIEDEIMIPLKESCNAKIYKYPTVSFSTQKVIFQRDDKEVTGKNVGVVTSRFFMMNFDGSDMEEIVIPD